MAAPLSENPDSQSTAPDPNAQAVAQDECAELSDAALDQLAGGKTAQADPLGDPLGPPL